MGEIQEMTEFEVTQIEKRRRGPLGWVVAILFYGFNAVMILLIALTWAGVGSVAEQNYDDASVAVAGVAGFLSTVALFWFWLFGAIILGIMMLLTRGKKVILTGGGQR